ncbi:MAG TPA: histidine phosphatase family protein [Actinospica sp.]|nr:histidine phosphatase family protein [Actinospica sp.]
MPTIPEATLPVALTAVRHGQSTANAAFAEANATGALTVPITERDADLPLTDLGRAQAADLGRRLAADPPRLVYCSPYLRARETMQIALAAAHEHGAPHPAQIPVRYDERLRDRETGAWEMLTDAALRRKYPEDIARREHVGRYYFRPPCGENFPDVQLRVRSVLTEALAAGAGRHLLIVAHDAVVLMLRMILDPLDEAALLDLLSRHGAVTNCAVTRWDLDRGTAGLRLTQANDATHLTPDRHTS